MATRIIERSRNPLLAGSLSKQALHIPPVCRVIPIRRKYPHPRRVDIKPGFAFPPRAGFFNTRLRPDIRNQALIYGVVLLFLDPAVARKRRVIVSARRLIETSHFGPETMKIVERAFDEVWEQIRHCFDGDAEAAKLDLAKAMINAVEDKLSAVEGVKAAALKKMRQRYPQRLNGKSELPAGDE
jgi:hypothetical protein